MGNRESPTTVNLTLRAQTAKKRLSMLFGLKNVLSAGVLLLNELPAELQQRAIELANVPVDDPRAFEVLADAQARSQDSGKTTGRKRVKSG